MSALYTLIFMLSSEVGQGRESEALYVSYPVHTFWERVFRVTFLFTVSGFWAFKTSVLMNNLRFWVWGNFCVKESLQLHT